MVNEQVQEEVPTRISEIIKDKMAEKNLTIRDVAMKTDVSYEHIRSIVRGNTTPSNYTLNALVQVLGLNLKEVKKVAVEDKIRKKFGKITLEMSGQNPELEPIEREWHKLSEEHKKDIIAMVRTYAERDRQ